MQEFVEKENIACLIGPLATAEALAIDDYIRDKQVPTLSVAAAEALEYLGVPALAATVEEVAV
jgi:ABC-type branched-subunit amino acid transport system substrate-binding protein